MSSDSAILSAIIKNRRSIFPAQYTGDTISREDIDDILENARWAPTHRRTEPWRFIVFHGERIRKLASFAAEWYKTNTPESSFSERKYQKRLNSPLKASHIVAICMQRDPEERVPEWEEIAAVACAVQNMLLTTSAKGLGAYWSTPGFALALDQYLPMPSHMRCLGLVYIGVPQEGIESVIERRRPLDEVVQWHGKAGDFP